MVSKNDPVCSGYNHYAAIDTIHCRCDAPCDPVKTQDLRGSKNDTVHSGHSRIVVIVAVNRVLQFLRRVLVTVLDGYRHYTAITGQNRSLSSSR